MGHAITPDAPPWSAWRVPEGDPALTPWLDDCAQPREGAVIWRIWLERPADGAALLAELDRSARPVHAAGVFHAHGLWLYLWLSLPNPSMRELLATYDAGVALVPVDHLRTSRVLVCGKALTRLLRGGAPPLEATLHERIAARLETAATSTPALRLAAAMCGVIWGMVQEELAREQAA